METARNSRSPRENLLAALGGEKPAYRPVISVCQYATYDLMKETGTSWPKAHTDAAEMAKLSAGGRRVFGLDAVRVPYGQTNEAQAFGAVLVEGETELSLPSIARHPCAIDEPPAFPAGFLDREPIAQTLEAVRLLKKDCGSEAAVMGGICGPFTIAGNLLGIKTILKNCQKNPGAVRPFIALGLKAAAVLAEAYREAGADIISIEDMMASMSMISPRIYRDLVFQAEKDLISQIKLPVILHICGRLDAVITEVAQTGTAAISVEEVVNIAEAKARLGEAGLRPVFIGNINTTEVLRSDDPGDTEKAVEAAIAQGVDIVSPGCAIAPDTPAANILRMIDRGRK
ncbi:MAG: hypothetical protein LBT16_10950 [Treponema sp.]|nr:hypothetical protein [Treponema sp.]